MKIDKKTGEILSFLPQNNKDIEPVKTILNCAINDDIKDMFPKESKGKVLWCNAAQDVLRNRLTPDSRHYFEEFCSSYIPAENYTIATREEIAEHLNIKIRQTERLMNNWKANGLIRILKKNHVKRGRHIYIINPTIVWKGYLHKNVIDKKDFITFSSTYRFSYTHKKSVEAWVKMYYTGYYKGILVES